MESENSVILDSCTENSVLIQTVKNIVTQSVDDALEDEDFFLVTGDQGGRQEQMEAALANVACAGNQADAQIKKVALTDLCRICANISDHMIPIFEGEGLQLELCNKIHKYLPIRISDRDILPLHLCYHCAATLLAWTELVDGCLGAERRLLEMQQTLQVKHEYTSMSNGTMEHVQMHVPESNGVEAAPSKDSEAQNLLEPDGGTATLNSDRWQAVSDDDVEMPGVEIEGAKAAEEVEYLECSLCDIALMGVVTLVRHMNAVHGAQVHYCRYCKLIYHGGAEDFEEHVTTHFQGTIENTTRESRVPRKRRLDNERDEEPFSDRDRNLENEQVVSNACNSCSEEFVQKCDLERHMNADKRSKIEGGKEVELVNQAARVVDDPISYEYEVDKKIVSNDNQKFEARQVACYTCSLCDEVFLEKSDLKRHIHAHTEKNRMVQNEEESELVNQARRLTDDRVSYKCELCEKTMFTKRGFLHHMRAHTEKNTREKVPFSNDNPELQDRQTARYTCSLCDKVFLQKSDLKRHIHAHAEKRKKVVNEEELELVNRARRLTNDRVSYKCELCEKTMFTKRGFLRHMRVHTGKRPCVCDACGKSYRIEQDLARHVRDVHEGLKNYVCDICDRAFANKGARDDHRRIHTGERPFSCEHCPKTFRTLNSIYIHNRVHTNYKPHECSYCGKWFRSRQRLNNHETTHTGVKAFACEICGKTFSVKGEVMRHRAIHNREKPFECKECGIRFGQKRYLRNHIKQHHKELSAMLLSELAEGPR